MPKFTTPKACRPRFQSPQPASKSATECGSALPQQQHDNNHICSDAYRTTSQQSGNQVNTFHITGIGSDTAETRIDRCDSGINRKREGIQRRREGLLERHRAARGSGTKSAVLYTCHLSPVQAKRQPTSQVTNLSQSVQVRPLGEGLLRGEYMIAFSSG
ncbi:hypothetical protein EVAR_94665_1 [Eumeta japonica]|uniref:Uncharacterized protein n=1 Tax=Eumeta variegata TaxID=151549 RepID=A0A4C1UTR6_EUMVA|nr:hypothetical protein EVAR_94665_1 [Eumeta japonica]